MHALTANHADWLMWFTADEETTVKAGGAFELPNGQHAATDGRMAMITGAGERILIHPEGRMSDIPARLVEFVAVPLVQSVTLDYDGMVATFGACVHPELSVCRRCDGKGETWHHCDCEFCEENTEKCRGCDGKGKATEWPDKRGVLLWGKPVDANRAAYILGAHQFAGLGRYLE